MRVVAFVFGMMLVVPPFALGMMHCSKQQQVAGGSNATLVGLVQQYKAEGMACVNKSPTKPEAQACIEATDKRWAPVWAAWDTYRKEANQ